MSSRPLFAYAEEAEDAAVEDTAGSEEGDGDAANEDEKGQQFVDSARELQEKLAQLKALLDAKGDDTDPALKEKLSGLENQLKGLGLDGLDGGSGPNPELTEFLSACVAMSMRRAGMQRPSTLSALRRLADGKLPPAEAAKNEFWRMVGVCVGDFREDEFAEFKQGKIKILPKSHVEASKTPEAEKKVLEIDAQNWEQLKSISAGLLKELSGGGNQEKPPFAMGWLALIPVVLAVAFLGKLFMDMQSREKEAANKKASKREGKKSK
jgi:hypothetical protein